MLPLELDLHSNDFILQISNGYRDASILNPRGGGGGGGGVARLGIFFR